MATPEWFSRLKRRTAEIIDFENDALERDMVRSQETPSEAQETEEDVARRLRVERERQEDILSIFETIGRDRMALESGVAPAAQSMQGIGYKELIPVVMGQGDVDRAVWDIIVHTRHYAKRQETWFRAEEAIRWVDAGPSALDGLRRMTDDFLMN